MYRNIRLKPEELISQYILGERDFSRLDLTYMGIYQGFPFDGVDLSGCDFSFTNLTEANLVGANLSDSNFSHTWGRGVRIGRCTLKGANLHRTYLGSTNLWGADLRGVDLREISPYLTDFRGAILDPVIRLPRWKLDDCTFDESVVIELIDDSSQCNCVEEETRRYR